MLYIVNKKLLNDESLIFKNRILKEYPNSDFAKHIINSDNLDINHNPSNLLKQAEDIRMSDVMGSIALYKEVLNIDKTTQSLQKIISNTESLSKIQ